MKKILIIGENNACRSQMAEGWMRYYTKGYADVTSAGIHKTTVDLVAAKSMSNAIIDISAQKSKQIEEVTNSPYDYVIFTFTPDNISEYTFTGEPKILVQNFNLPNIEDDTKKTNANYDALRDEIENFCFDFVHQNIRKLY